MASPLDLSCDQGTTWRYALDIQDAAGQPVDYSAYGAKMHIRKTAATSTLLIELSTTNGRIVITPGKIELRLDPAETSPLRSGEYVYDLELTAPGGEVSRLIEGSFSLIPEITRG